MTGQILARRHSLCTHGLVAPYMNYLPLLRTVIRATYGCDCVHVKSIRTDAVSGDVLWRGWVERFHVIDHPGADCAYGWNYRDRRGIQSIVVLGIPGVETAADAVRFAFDRAAGVHA